jgi:hypothetical protein
LKGASQFKKHLNYLLNGKDTELSSWPRSSGLRVDLSTFYSVFINKVSNQDLRNRELVILKDKETSYQKYRALLLFRHILAYALLQACGAAVEGKLPLPNGLRLILGGNGWGLTAFAGLPRDTQAIAEEAGQILKLLQGALIPSLTDEEKKFVENLKISSVDLLNDQNLSKAKVGVATGALETDRIRRSRSNNVKPFTGITLKNFKINDFDEANLKWCERWGGEQFKSKFGPMDQINQSSFEKPSDLSKPLDPNLVVFSYLGNSGRRDRDIMPPDTWNSINDSVIAHITYLQDTGTEEAPINHFISKVLYSEKSHDFLDILAQKNNNY